MRTSRSIPFPFGTDLDSAPTEQLRERRTSLEFIYLRPAKQDVTIYNPYDLEIVGHSDVDQNDFYTMSMAGVTRFMAGTAGAIPGPLLY